MKCLFLAAGYATRMYPLTENFPKPLLKIDNKTIIDYLIDDLETIECCDEYIVVTNGKFFDIFSDWKQQHPLSNKITLVNDGTFTNETRLGAVNDIDFSIKTLHIDDDLMIMAGDNLLDFSLRNFVEMFKEKNTSLVMAYKEEKVEQLRKSAVLVIKESKVIDFEEKPSNPKSNWCCPPFYIYKRDDVKRIKEAINNGCKLDAPGSLASWFSLNSTLLAYYIPGKRFDIGSIKDFLNYQNKKIK